MACHLFTYNDFAVSISSTQHFVNMAFHLVLLNPWKDLMKFHSVFDFGRRLHPVEILATRKNLNDAVLQMVEMS